MEYKVAVDVYLLSVEACAGCVVMLRFLCLVTLD